MRTVDFSQLERTDYATYCPYKGDCNYYGVPGGRKKSVNAVWSYEDPFPAVVQIKGHVAFYPDRVDEIAEHSQRDERSTDWITAPRLRPIAGGHSMTQNKNRQWILNVHPAVRLTGEEFRWNETSIPQPSDGQVLVRNLWLSVEKEDPAMHKTNTVDYAVVYDGEIWLELDNSETLHLRRGDVVVQNGTRHAWRNKSTQPPTMLFFLNGATA